MLKEKLKDSVNRVLQEWESEEIEFKIEIPPEDSATFDQCGVPFIQNHEEKPQRDRRLICGRASEGA